MGTKMALLDRSQVIVQIDRIVWASLHASPATDAGVAIDIDNSIGPFRKRVHRADRDAWRIGAVIAALHQKVALDIGKLTDFDILDRCPKVPNRHVVFRFASGGAGMAADARVVVDDKAVLHAWGFYT